MPYWTQGCFEAAQEMPSGRADCRRPNHEGKTAATVSPRARYPTQVDGVIPNAPPPCGRELRALPKHTPSSVFAVYFCASKSMEGLDTDLAEAC